MYQNQQKISENLTGFGARKKELRVFEHQNFLDSRKFTKVTLANLFPIELLRMKTDKEKK